MTSMLVNAWLCLLLQLLVGVRSSNSTVLGDSLAVVGGLQILQLGSLSLLVYVATVWLEDGFFTTIKNVLKQFVAGGGKLLVGPMFVGTRVVGSHVLVLTVLCDVPNCSACAHCGCALICRCRQDGLSRLVFLCFQSCPLVLS
jgi:hypothetical protein